MNPKGYIDAEAARALIDGTKSFKAKDPGRVETHFDHTGYFREVHDSETGVLDGIKDYMRMMPPTIRPCSALPSLLRRSFRWRI